MTLTRDQLRAARVLLQLRVGDLAKLAKVGLATLRRFEGGQDVGELYVDALRRAIEQQGAIPIEDEALGAGSAAVGVALRPESSLPADTLARTGGGRQGADRCVRAQEAGPSAEEVAEIGTPASSRRRSDRESVAGSAGRSRPPPSNRVKARGVGVAGGHPKRREE